MIALAAHVTVQPDRGANVGADLIDTLAEWRVQHKAAAIICGVDTGQWTRSLTGQAPIDLWKLRELDVPLVADFFARVLRSLLLAQVDRIAADVKTMAVAKLRSAEDPERRRA